MERHEEKSYNEIVESSICNEIVNMSIKQASIFPYMTFNDEDEFASTKDTVGDILGKTGRNKSNSVALENHETSKEFNGIKFFAVETSALLKCNEKLPPPLWLLTPDIFIATVVLGHNVKCGHLVKIFNTERKAVIGGNKFNRKINYINIIDPTKEKFCILSRNRFSLLLTFVQYELQEETGAM